VVRSLNSAPRMRLTISKDVEGVGGRQKCESENILHLINLD
jgi:hypothetical protein